MFNLRKAQILSQKIENQYRINLQPIKWTSIYTNESEIIQDLQNVIIPNDSQINLILYIYSGYEYIHSFAKQVQEGKTLTTNQIAQCKRLALEIKKASVIAECYK
jgi:hypothetical protein